MFKNKVVYTASIGNYDTIEPPEYVNDDFDYICFSDTGEPIEGWEVRKITPLFADNTRTARYYKVLPHIHLPEYDYSIWIDGNRKIVGDLNHYLQYLDTDTRIATFDHAQSWDSRNCIYDEANAILDLGNRNGSYKDNPSVIKAQMERYRKDGYPSQYGLSYTCVVAREHCSKWLIRAMNRWWLEITYGSKRDQLSLNYALWKTETHIAFFNGDGRGDGFVKETKHNKHK